MNVAFIPVRGGSKSIPLKNIKMISGRPLVFWTIRAACGCKQIDKVFVATDSEKIRAVVDEIKAKRQIAGFEKLEVIGRSPETATDTASTESAMLEFAEQHSFDNIVLIQATSPLLQSKDLEQGFAVYHEDGTDSVLSVVRQKRFNWSVDENGLANPVNYDVFHRPRRQEFDGYFVENGAFYITSREALLQSRNRLSGNIRAVEMDEATFFEIDEPSDWLIIEALMKKKGISASHDMPEIKMFLTDCDGCLTDSGMYYSENGDELKKFNTRDGRGFQMLRENDIITGIVTSEDRELNRRRAEKLKLDILVGGCKDKLAAISDLCRQRGVDLKNVCYIGDDLNDLEVLEAVGFGCCPSDAVEQVKHIASFVTESKGGQGVIREVAELVLDVGIS